MPGPDYMIPRSRRDEFDDLTILMRLRTNTRYPGEVEE